MRELWKTTSSDFVVIIGLVDGPVTLDAISRHSDEQIPVPKMNVRGT